MAFVATESHVFKVNVAVEDVVRTLFPGTAMHADMKSDALVLHGLQGFEPLRGPH